MKKITCILFLFSIILLLNSCIDYNVFYIPQNANQKVVKSKNDIKTEDFFFSCYAADYNKKMLGILNYINWDSQKIKILYQTPILYYKKDSIILTKKNEIGNYDYEDLNKIKFISIYLKYSIEDTSNTRLVEERFLLIRKRRFFIHGLH